MGFESSLTKRPGVLIKQTNFLHTTHCTVTREAPRHASLVHLVCYGLDKQTEKNPLHSKANEVVWKAMAHMSEHHLTM